MYKSKGKILFEIEENPSKKYNHMYALRIGKEYDLLLDGSLDWIGLFGTIS